MSRSDLKHLGETLDAVKAGLMPPTKPTSPARRAHIEAANRVLSRATDREADRLADMQQRRAGNMGPGHVLVLPTIDHIYPALRFRRLRRRREDERGQHRQHQVPLDRIPPF